MDQLDKIIKKLNKLSLPTVILIASLIVGGFYYASEVNKQQSIERQQQIKIEQEKQDQLTKELKEQEAKTKAEQALNTCIANAEESSSNFWNSECKAKGLLSNKCILLLDMTFDEYVKQNNIPSVKENLDENLKAVGDFYKQKRECSCLLPTYNADRVDESLKRAKDECFKKYPQN